MVWDLVTLETASLPLPEKGSFEGSHCFQLRTIEKLTAFLLKYTHSSKFPL